MTIDFTPTTWVDFPSTATLITAAQLQRLEDAVEALVDAVNDVDLAYDNTGNLWVTGSSVPTALDAVESAFVQLDSEKVDTTTVDFLRANQGGKGGYVSTTAGTETKALSLAEGNLIRVELTGNPTFTFPAIDGGFDQAFVLRLVQDGTGGRTVTWPGSSTIVWPTGAAPTLSTTAGAGEWLAFIAEPADGKWHAFHWTASNQRVLRAVLDGGGSAIATGAKSVYMTVPFDCVITKARLLADQSGSIVIDVWKDTYANFPPTNADSITASAPPTLSGAQKSEDSTLTGWTTSLSAGDILELNVDSAATVTKVYLDLFVTPR